MAARISIDKRPAFQPRDGRLDAATAYLLWTISGKTEVKESGCWEWVGWHQQGTGYGSFRINEKVHRVHRLIYECCVEEIPANIFVCHKCDNPPCCNPVHLFLGTEQDNIIDCVRKNRHPDQILTVNDVKIIRQLTSDPAKRHRYFYRSLANKYGVSIDTIRSVIYENTWRHVK